MAAFFINLIIQIVIAIIISELFSKPKLTNAKPAGMGDFSFPTASSSRCIPVVWGTQELKAPNMTWAGDFHAIPIEKKVKTGLFSSKNVTTGYEYYIGLQLALCLGGEHPVDNVSRLRYGDKTAWRGTALNGNVYHVDARTLYGGRERGGGIEGHFRFYDGNTSQDRDAYLARYQGQNSNPHRGVAYVVWYSRGAGLADVDATPIYAPIIDDLGNPVLDEDGNPLVYLVNPIEQDKYGYVSNSSSIKPFNFTVSRFPNGLGLPIEQAKMVGGANPANMIHELLTDNVFGLGISEALIELPDLQALAQTCYDENLALSMTWMSERTAEDMMQDILDHIAGVYFEDKTTGKLRFKLIRGDYDTGSLPTLTKPNIIEVKDYTKTNWEGSMNEIALAYSEPTRFYDNEIVTATDLGNAYIQGKVVPRSIVYYGITDASVALNVAYRELKLVSLPLTRVTLVCDRSVSQWQVGDLFIWSDPDYGVDQIVMRVGKVERGDLYNQTMTLYCSQDIYSIDESIYSVPDTDGTGIGDLEAVAMDIPTIVELPLHLCSDTTDLETSELMVLPERPDLNTTSYIPYWAETSSLTENDIDDESDPSFVTTLILNKPIKEGRPYYEVGGKIEVTSSTASLVAEAGLGGTLLLIDDELIAFDSINQTESGYVFVGIYSAMHNTTLKPHAAGTVIKVINGGGYFPLATYADNANIDYKLVAQGATSSFEFSNTALREYTVYGEKSRPYVLTEYTLNGDYKTLIEPYTDVTVQYGISPKVATSINSPNLLSLTAEVDVTHTISVMSTGAEVYNTTSQTLIGETADSVVIPLSGIYGLYTSYPPYLEFWAYPMEDVSLERSTQTALAIAEVEQYTMNLPASKQSDEPSITMVLFDGELIGVK